MMNIEHILSRGHRAGGLAEASGTSGFAMRFIMSLLLLVTVGGGSSVWAQAVSQLPSLTSGVYEMLNISNESGAGTGRGYLVNYTNASSGIGLADCTYSQYRGSHPTVKNSANTCSYWYLHKNENGSYTIVSLSILGGNEQPRFIQVGDPSSLTTTETELVFADATNANHVRDGKKAIVIANKTASNQYMSAACGTNSNNNCIKRTTTITDGGNPWLFIPVAESSLSEGQKAIRAKYLERFAHLKDGVTINFQDKEGNPITGETVVYTPTSGPAVNLTSSTGTYNFGDVLYSPSLFSAADFAKILSVAYNETAKTLTFTITQNKWYYIKVNNGGYMSSAYVNGSGDMMLNNANKPTDYEGLWMEIPATDLDANGQGTVYFVNAYYGDTKILAITGSDGNASAKMYSKTDVPAGAVTLFDRKYRADRDGAFFFKSAGSANNYLNKNNNKFAYWNNANAYNNPDVGSTFDHVAVPNLPNNAHIVFEATSSDIDIMGLNIVYRNLEFYRMVDGVSTQFQSGPTIFSELTNGANFNFANVPYLSSCFSIYNRKDLRILRVEIDGTNVKFIIDKLPMIVHRTPWTVDKVNGTAAGSIPPANTGFLQQDLTNKGMKENTNTTPATKIQNVPVFEVTEYIKPGVGKQIWLPTCNTNGSNSSLWSYQRWYDYKTEGSVNPAVYDFQTNKSNGKLFGNGFVTGAIYGDFIEKDITVNLPTGTNSYDLALDHSRFEDYKKNFDGKENLLEPTISQRVIYHLVDANVMAQKLEDVATDKWLEEYTIHFPSYKMGSKDARNGFDVIGLDQTFGNYWYYADATAKTGKNPTQVTSKSDFTFEVTCTDPNVAVKTLGIGVLEKNNNTMPSDLNLQLPKTFAGQRFIMFNYPASRKFADKSELVIKVSVHGKRVAKFTLIFDDGTEPLPILDVIGKDSNGTRKSSRSTSAMIEQYGLPIAKVTFDGPQIPFQYPTSMSTSVLSGNTYNWSNANDARYGLPVSNEYTDYSFFGGGGSGNNTYMAMGEYRLESGGNGTSGRFKIRPVEEYEAALNDPSGITTPGYKQYFAFADVSEQPGKIISLPFSTTLCKGQRIFMQGWVGSATSSNDNSQQQSGVVLNVYGIKNNQRTLVYSYCPGIISSAIEKNGVIYRSVENDFSGYRQTCADNSDWNNQGFVIWNQVNCSFLVKGDIQYDSYQLEVDNNSYSSTGCDVIIDNFYVFVNPPKGNVDFTTPLCSDKTRHAKIYADFDMLKNISNVNESDKNAKLYVTCCFLESDVFDNYTNGTLKISDIFDVDDKGNHNLKAAYADDENAKALINAAFGAALVGTRHTSVGNPADHGFHVYEIGLDYENDIPEYAYNDSKTDKVYREVVDGIRRIVFKEDVIRGEMELLPGGRYPHMRPSTTYYLVFSPMKATQEDINHNSTATDIFHIHESCSFFGKFTTKDPMHVILDNADIEADLPITAVCHGETTAFQFNMPAMKFDKNNEPIYPIVDEAYCISDESLDGKMVPESQGLHHYKYEPILETKAVTGIIKNLPYDWWLGGTLNGTTYRGTIEAYNNATHPTRTYLGPQDIAHKQDNAPVKIAQAMTDFRFFYPDFGKEGNTDWSTVVMKPYNPETGYGLLNSEIETIKDFVNAGIILLHRNTYDMPLTYEEAEQLQLKELNDMMEKDMNDNILKLALKLDDDSAIKAKKPLKAIEGTVLGMLSVEGRKGLTFEEFASFTYEQLQGLADKLNVNRTLPESELHKAVETKLKAMTDEAMLEFAKNNFPDIGHEKRAYLVVRALNILSKETVAKLPAADQQNTTKVREALRAQMINVFKKQEDVVLRKMWSDTSAELTEDERAALLKDNEHPDTPKNPATMSADELAVLLEDALAKITDNVIADMSSDRYVHFTLVPIMPSQDNYVDEPYIFCPEPRGVKLRITSHEPKMLDGFADMDYPDDLENVPVRLGLAQIRETKAGAAKTLRIPVRGLKQAAKDGVKAVRVADTGYGNYLFLVETNDPAYKQNGASASGDGLTEAVNDDGTYKRMIGKVVEEMAATYPTQGNQSPDNYLTVKFENDMNFREGYTYRVGLNFMEYDKENHPTISCYGTMLLDLKIVPEYQKWTAAVNTDWTNDGNWARADRGELNANNAVTGSVIAGSTDITVADNYPTNAANTTAKSFVPMYFTNVLFDKNTEVTAPEITTPAAVLYGGLTEAKRTAEQKNFLGGLKSTATDKIIYDMEVAPSEGKGTWAASDNYECTLFGTYIANGITFKPGSQLINAQHLTYNKAWVEYELTTNRWYTLASPLQNTFAGEWYSPSAGGKQLTPHFYDITYQQGAGSQQLNDRFRPAYYQRSWDSKGNNPVYLKSGGTQEAYIMADWSYVYNDVKKEYSNGGFSVMVDDSHMGDDSPADHKALNRMPKADTQYTYFDFDGNTAQQAKTDDISQLLTAKRNRLWSDELKTAASFTQTITNQTADNNFFLVANPFMANMDMDAFFAANNEKIEPKFWIMTANGQEVSMKTETGWVSTSDQVTTLGKSAPLQGFFVKGKTSSNKLEVTYNAAMQATASATAQLKSKGAKASSIEMLTIKATRDDISSTAVIALSKSADKEFVTTEDCETFIDSNIADQPTIYTVASGQAMTVNTVPAIDMIPLGILGETGQTVEVTFSGMSGLCLYDSKDNSYTDINEGTEVTMEAKTSGRYFITSSSSTTAIDRLSVEKAERKGIYTLGGQYVGEDIKTLAPGLYIVNGVKMRVK